MEFLLSVIDHQTGLATESEMADITAFNTRLRADGHWVFAGGLEPLGSAAIIDNRGGAAVFIEGPMHQADEYVSGFWIVTAPDRDIACRLAMEASKACNRRIECRALLGG